MFTLQKIPTIIPFAVNRAEREAFEEAIRKHIAQTPDPIFLIDLAVSLGISRQKAHRHKALVTRLAQEAGRHVATKQEVRKRRGIFSGITRLIQSDNKILPYLHREDMTQREIAKEIGRSQQFVSALMRRDGTSRKSNKGRPQKPQHIAKRLASTRATKDAHPMLRGGRGKKK